MQFGRVVEIEYIGQPNPAGLQNPPKTKIGCVVVNDRRRLLRQGLNERVNDRIGRGAKLPKRFLNVLPLKCVRHQDNCRPLLTA